MAAKVPPWTKVTEKNRERVAKLLVEAVEAAEKDGSDKPYILALRSAIARLPVQRRPSMRDTSSYRQTDLSRRLIVDATRAAARDEVIEALRKQGTLVAAASALGVGHRTLCRLVAQDEELTRRIAKLRESSEAA